MWYRAEDVAKLCECSKSKAYNIINSLNKLKSKEGIPIIAGKVNKDFFHEKMGIKKVD